MLVSAAEPAAQGSRVQGDNVRLGGFLARALQRCSTLVLVAVARSARLSPQAAQAPAHSLEAPTPSVSPPYLPLARLSSCILHRTVLESADAGTIFSTAGGDGPGGIDEWGECACAHCLQ